MNNKIDENFFAPFHEEWRKFVEENEKEYKLEEEQRIVRLKQERKEYLKSLKPITLDEFIVNLKKLTKKYKKILKKQKAKGILFCSLDFDAQDILTQAQCAKNGLELAELIDKNEKKIDDLESVTNLVSKATIIARENLKQRG